MAVMDVLGIDEITYGVEDLAACRKFFLDWGLTLVEDTSGTLVFETLNKCRVVVKPVDHPSLPPAIEAGSTLREVVWGVSSEAVIRKFDERLKALPGYVSDDKGDGKGRVGCTDPNGVAVRFQVTRKIELELHAHASNTWNVKNRVNERSPIYERATPIEVGHVVFFVKDSKVSERFYVDNFGFAVSDRYPTGSFLRCAPEGGHHDMFLLQPAEPDVGLNHVAFTVRDLHEVVGGGLHMARQGYTTTIGPGRHPISSAFFWYFKCPAGALIEYYADEDQLTGDWEPGLFQPGPTLFTEWAVDGGLDGFTRRQKEAKAPDGKFLTSRKP